MAYNFDFTIVDADFAGFKRIVPQNEEAFSYLVEETMLSIFQDGSSVLFNENVGDFINDAEHAHMCCEYV